jgi:uncharacterized protein
VALVIGTSKAGLNGISLLVIPVMALIFGVKESTVVIVPMLITADIMPVVYYRRHAAWKQIIRVLPCMAVGVITTSVTGNLINANQFRIVLLTVVWIMLILMILNDFRKDKGKEIPENHLFASLMDIAGGFLYGKPFQLIPFYSI